MKCAFIITKHAFQHKVPTRNFRVAMGNTPSHPPVHPIQEFSDNPPTALQDQRETSPCQHECSDLSFLSSGAFPGPPLVSNILLDSLKDWDVAGSHQNPVIHSLKLEHLLYMGSTVLKRQQSKFWALCVKTWVGRYIMKLVSVLLISLWARHETRVSFFDTADCNIWRTSAFLRSAVDQEILYPGNRFNTFKQIQGRGQRDSFPCRHFQKKNSVFQPKQTEICQNWCDKIFVQRARSDRRSLRRVTKTFY